MHIDRAIEERVRDALGAVIDRDGDRMVATLDGLSPADLQHALGLGLFAVGYVVNDIHPEGVTDAELNSLAQQIVDSEADWISLDPEALKRLLLAASRGDASLPGIKPNDAVGLTFISGGHLLAAFRADKERWFQYLDEIWGALAAAPDPQISHG